jgi:LacI family gluconate utilization system Gnt-I transcriptional repressor
MPTFKNDKNRDSSGKAHPGPRPADSVLSGRGTGSVTLDDVAKLAGVSPITVSRALNYPNKVAPKTLEKINQAIARTGYVPNLLAGGLASRKSRLIAAIIPSLANSVYAETIQYFSDRLRESGYQVLLGESGYLESREESLITAVLSRRPDGIFLTGINHSMSCRRLLSAANIPVVETWDITPTPLDVVVGFSHERIGQAVADFLVGKGYRHIGVLTADDHRAQIRKRAFIETLAKHGIVDVAIRTVPTPTSFRLGREGIAQLLDSGFTGAVFCSSDTLAQGALAEAQSRGLSVPGQLAIAGFGDQPYAAYTFPSLTTVRFDRAVIGQRAADALIARINGESVLEKVIDVGFTIVERQTA